MTHECLTCGGHEEVEVTMADGTLDFVGCPECIARQKNAEIERLRAFVLMVANLSDVTAQTRDDDDNADTLQSLIERARALKI